MKRAHATDAGAPVDLADASLPTVYAAGTIPWRRTRNGRIKVLLINRRKQGDLSFPKGKLDPGEGMPQAAVRETAEEVGLDVALGVNLGTINYLLATGQRKTVQYWAAEVSREDYKAHVFVPNSEVQDVRWVLLEEARNLLSYEADRELFDVFCRLVQENMIETHAVILLRHAKAMPRGSAFPEDRHRPLADLGDEQAEAIVPTLAAFGPERIVTSTARRCLSTVQPVAGFVHRPIEQTEAISQDTWDTGDSSGMRDLIADVVRDERTVILCSHRPVLPDLARELAYATHTRYGAYLDEAVALPTGAFSVFHIARENPAAGIVAVEVYPVRAAP